MFLFLSKFTLKMQRLSVTRCVCTRDKRKRYLLLWLQQMLRNALTAELKYFLLVDRSCSQVSFFFFFSSFLSVEKCNFKFRVQNYICWWQLTILRFDRQLSRLLLLTALTACVDILFQRKRPCTQHYCSDENTYTSYRQYTHNNEKRRFRNVQ